MTIPEGWKETLLGEVINLSTGKLNSNASEENGIYPFFTCAPTTLKINKYEFDQEALLLAGNNANGKYTIKYFSGKFNAYQRTYIISSSRSNLKFLFYLLGLKLNYLQDISQGTATKFLTTKIINDIEFLLPPLPEQKAIAEVLSSLDSKIELLREQNQTLEAIAQAIFKEWFVNFNFLTTDGKPYRSSGGTLIDSELGHIPEGWRVGKLGEEFKVVMGQSPEGESYNETGDGIIFFQGRTDFKERFPEVRLYTTSPKRFAEKFDVLVSVRAPVGDINVASVRCCIGRGLCAIRSNFKSYSLYQIKTLKDIFNNFEAEGTIFGAINKDSMMDIKVVIPPNNVVKNFEEKVNPIDRKIYNNYRQIQTLSTLREELLPKLMKGELRVSGF